MKFANFILIFLLIISYTGCKTSAPQQNIPLTKDTIITLNHSTPSGRGSALNYSIKISGDGTVIIFGSMTGADQQGKQQSTTIPTAQRTINPEQLQQLIEEFNKINYLSLKDSYQSQGPDCPDYWTHSYFAATSIKTGDITKSVTRYAGCHGTEAMKNLNALEKKIDELAQTEQWLR